MKNLFAFILIGLVWHATAAQNWSALGAGTTGGLSGARCIFTDTLDNSIYIGGDFDRSGGVRMPGIARWDGSQWQPLGKGITNALNYADTTQSVGQALAIIRYKGYIYVGGIFDYVDGGNVKAGGLARWDGSQWHSAGRTVTARYDSTSGDVIRMRILNDELYVMGSFDSIGGISAPGIAKYDGTQWKSVVPFFKTSPGWQIADAIYYKGELYIAGNFATTMGITYDDIFRWDGTQFHSLGKGLDSYNSQVNVLKIYQGDLYAGGLFYKHDGDPGDCIAKWDGTQWSEVGGGFTNQPQDMIVFGGDLYAGGYLNGAGVPNTDHMAIWNGTQWSGVNSNFKYTDLIEGFAIQNNHLYIGGYFDTLDNVVLNNVAKYNFTPNGIKEVTASNGVSTLYPNPVSLNATFVYSLPNTATSAFLKIYDIRGRLTHSYPLNTQENSLNISASDFENGVYLYGIESEYLATTKKKMVVVK